jgi:hypothetical protein
METEAAVIDQVTVETETFGVPLKHGECLTGEVKKPFIKDSQLLGAVLSFEGRSETALLHLRQMSGDDSPSDRLAELAIGDPIKVRVMVVMEGDERKVWATEKGVEYQGIVDLLQSDRDQFRNVEGKVHGLTDFGVFVELLASPASGHRGLLRTTAPRNSGRLKLGAFVPFRVGAPVIVDVVEARIDDNAKLLLRVDNLQLRAAAE